MYKHQVIKNKMTGMLDFFVPKRRQLDVDTLCIKDPLNYVCIILRTKINL